MTSGINDGRDAAPEQASPPYQAPLTPVGAAAALREAGLIDPALTECVALAGGTASRIAALGRPGAAPELVVKLNAPAVVQAEVLFLRTYGGSPLLPALRHVDAAYRFLACDFVPGVRIRYGEDRVDVAAVLLRLVRDLLARYVPAAGGSGQGLDLGRVAPLSELLEATAEASDAGPGSRGSGTPSRTVRTWTRFLGDHVAYRHASLAVYVSDEDRRLVERLARAERRTERAPLCLIHGDCGAHNFLFGQGSGRAGHVGPLNAVIDPYPLVGYPIYDLAFAFVSWPNGFDPEAILLAADALRGSGRWRPNGEPQQLLWEQVLIALYMRMATCLVHHPRDLPAYLAAWPRWRALAAGRAAARVARTVTRGRPMPDADRPTS
jgi:hypothetical protein